jgi:hypothetical protein
MCCIKLGFYGSWKEFVFVVFVIDKIGHIAPLKLNLI